MLYKDHSFYKKKRVNIFGKGDMYNQLKPLLIEEKIEIQNIFDDFSNNKKFSTNNYSSQVYTELPMIYCVGYKDMHTRIKRFNELKNMGIEFTSFIAKNSILSTISKLDNGSIINQGCIIDNYVEIGECTFINIGTTISHHSKINRNVFIAPGVNIAGYVNINEGVFIGTNATIIDHINIGKYSVIAAGAVVINDVPPYSMVAGNPAVVKKELNNK